MTPRYRIAADFDTPAWRDWLLNLPRESESATPDRYLPGGRNELLRLSFQNKDLVVKRFRNRGLWKKVAYRISSSKARRSFEHSEQINAAGLHSPTPVAWFEIWNGPWLSESFYICEYLDFQHDAYALSDPSLPKRIEKAALVGRTCAKLHEAGLAHLDLNSGNLLFSQDSRENWLIHIIDNNRMRFRPIPLDQACDLLLRANFDGAILDAMLTSYAQTRNHPIELLRERYFSKRDRFKLNRRIKDATRPWRRKVGL